MLLLSHHHSCKTIDLALTYYKLLLKLSHRGMVYELMEEREGERREGERREGGGGRERERREEILYYLLFIMYYLSMYDISIV